MKVMNFNDFIEVANNTEDQLSLVIKCHFELDSILDKLLTLSMYDASSLEVRRISFILKVDMLIGLGILSKNVRPLFNNINSIRNIYAHNPYSIFDKEMANKTKTIIMQVEDFKTFVRDDDVEKHILVLAFTIAYVCLEKSLKDQYRAIQSNEILNEKIKKALSCSRMVNNHESRQLHDKKVNDELKKKYPDLFDE